ncbi:MAG: hypothetical protein ABIG44_00320 [Planctomycetota bacterium]
MSTCRKNYVMVCSNAELFIDRPSATRMITTILLFTAATAVPLLATEGLPFDNRDMPAAAGGQQFWWDRLGRGPLCDNGIIYSVCTNHTMPLVVAAGRKGRSSDGLLKIYDLHTGKVLFSVLHKAEPSGAFLSIACTRDGRKLAAGDKSGTVTVWAISVSDEAASSVRLEPAASFTLPTFVASLAFSPDGALLAMGCADCRIRVLELSSGKIVAQLPGHAGAVTGVAFSGDGKYLASAGGDDGTVKVWSVAPFKPLMSLQRGSAVATELAFLSDGDVLVAAYGDSRTGRRGAETLMDHPSEQLRFWRRSTEQMEQAARVGGDRVNSVAISSDGRLLAAGYEHRRPNPDNSVALRDIPSGRHLATITGRWRGPTARFVRNTCLLTVFSGHNIELWDLEEPEKPKRVWHDKWHWLDKASGD